METEISHYQLTAEIPRQLNRNNIYVLRKRELTLVHVHSNTNSSVFRQPFKIAKPVFFRLVRWRKAKCFVSEVKRGYSEAKSEALT